MPGRNKFDMSHDLKYTFRMGKIIPAVVEEVLPGDVWQFNMQNMLRFQPLISPVMHKVRVKTNFFFVPTRLLWEDWDKWISNESELEHPYVQVSDTPYPIRSVADYLGMPTDAPNNPAEPIRLSPIFLAAYRLIYDEYFRDQNLQDPTFVPLVPGDNSDEYGPEGNVLYPLNRAWEHDYFTSALPFAQKGPAVEIPLTQDQSIPVELVPFTENDNPMLVRENDSNTISDNGGLTNSDGPVPFTRSLAVDDDHHAVIDPNGRLKVDVQGAAQTINALRLAYRLQEWFEKNARGGTRYVEMILSHFGVRSSDQRLQRPEYIGGDLQNMVISEVLSTAENTDASIPVGQMAGHGISVGGGKPLSYRATEHGVIIGLISVVPDTAYQQGAHKRFTRFDRFDYAWPTFANIGEQEVRNKEVYFAHPQPEGTFGYVPRYSEYKFANSRVAGEMKTNLDFWHLGRKFSTPPALNSQFIACNPSPRIFAVTSPEVDHIVAHSFIRARVARALPRFGIPTI